MDSHHALEKEFKDLQPDLLSAYHGIPKPLRGLTAMISVIDLAQDAIFADGSGELFNAAAQDTEAAEHAVVPPILRHAYELALQILEDEDTIVPASPGSSGLPH